MRTKFKRYVVGSGLVLFGVACGMGISVYAATMQHCYFPGSMEPIVCEQIEIADPVVTPEPVAVVANDPAPEPQPVENTEQPDVKSEPVVAPVQVEPEPIQPCTSN